MLVVPRSDLSTDQPSAKLDILARDYILSLARGEKLVPRPEVGCWESVIESIERVYDRSSGDTSKVVLVIEALSSQNQGLAELLTPPSPTLEEIVAQDTSELFPPLPPEAQLPCELSRGACNYLDIYEQFSRKASPEAHDEFHVFCGMLSLSVALARRAYLPLGRKKIYGNVMIAMCAKTSMFAKSTTAQVARDVLSAADLGFLLGPDRASPQKLLSDMAGCHVPANYAELSVEKQELVRLRLAMAGQRGLIFDEFGKFVQAALRKGSSTADFIELLLTLDGCPQEYEYTTISRGSEPIQRPYLSLLGSMTYPNLKENARAGADFWTDGFWARFSFIAAPPDQFKDQALDAGELPVPGELITSLRAWHHRLGVPNCFLEPLHDKNGNETGRYIIHREDLPEHACTISDSAYSAWKTYRSALKRLLLAFPHEDFHGSYTRLPETALRMAVIMASLENNNHIEIRHWAKAQELAEILRKNLHELYRQVNLSTATSPAAKAEDEIMSKMQHLASKGITSLTIAQLKGSYLKSYSLKDLREIVDNMVRAGVLKREITAHAQSGKYSLIRTREETYERIG